MLDKDVPDNCKTCKEYFSVLAHYVAEVSDARMQHQEPPINQGALLNVLCFVNCWLNK